MQNTNKLHIINEHTISNGNRLISYGKKIKIQRLDGAGKMQPPKKLLGPPNDFDISMLFQMSMFGISKVNCNLSYSDSEESRIL